MDDLKHANIFHSKTVQNIPKLGFLDYLATRIVS
jgi:hypothetical protein